jgi:hypothetical protein
MRSRWLAVATVSAAAGAATCYKPTDYANCSDCKRDADSDSTVGDVARSDVAIPDAPDNCFGTSPAHGGHLQVCPLTVPQTRDFSTTKTIDTTTALECERTAQIGTINPAPMVCVIVGTTVHIGSAFTATGAYPLVIVATDTISIGAPLSVSSHLGIATPGAGGGLGCTTPGGISDPAGGGGGGGGGGKLMGGAGGGATNAAGGTGGIVQPVTAVTGGCNGGGGGNGNGGTPAPGGALGAGAVFLIARQTISVSSTISAGGAGGHGGPLEAGGAGGGAGGMIGFDAPVINMASGAVVFATGGGGGEGGGPQQGISGADAIGPTVASGGYSDSCNGVIVRGGNGGAGSAAQAGSTSTVANCGGGGGGGAVGHVYASTSISGSATIVPPLEP